MLEKYKAITLNIIDLLKEDKDIDTLMEEREYILKQIESQNISKLELIDEYKRLSIKEVDDDLFRLLESKMKEVKLSISNSKTRRTAFSSYSSSNRKGNLFAKKV